MDICLRPGALKKHEMLSHLFDLGQHSSSCSFSNPVSSNLCIEDELYAETLRYKCYIHRAWVAFTQRVNDSIVAESNLKDSNAKIKTSTILEEYRKTARYGITQVAETYSLEAEVGICLSLWRKLKCFRLEMCWSFSSKVLLKAEPHLHSFLYGQYNGIACNKNYQRDGKFEIHKVTGLSAGANSVWYPH